MKGRRPTPSHLKVVKGNPGKRPGNKREPKPRGMKEAPPPPKHLGAEAKRAWLDLAPMVHRLGVLTEADLYALEMMAECYAEMRSHRKALRKGYTYNVKTKGGGTMTRRRPEAAMLADADRRFKGYLVEFGLTPAARGKVSTNGETPEDPAEGYFED